MLSALNEPAPSPGQGLVRLERSGSATVATRLLAREPLRLFTPRGAGPGALLVLGSLGGGLVDGDQIDLTVELGPDAQALLTTQATTKVYRGPRGARQRLWLRLGEGSTLACVPDAVACFDGARLWQRTEAQLSQGASLALLEGYTAGRPLHRDRWAFARYESRLRVEQAGAPLIDETTLLDPAHGPLPARLGRFDAVASLLLVGPRLADARRSLVDALAARPLGRRAPVVEALGPLGPEGLLLRLAAVSPLAMNEHLRRRLAVLEPVFGPLPLQRKG